MQLHSIHVEKADILTDEHITQAEVMLIITGDTKKNVPAKLKESKTLALEHKLIEVSGTG